LLQLSGIAYAMGPAQSGGAQGAGGSGWLTIVPFVLMFVIFYFLLIRPQQKKEKERKDMISSIQKGDKVLTAGGIYGVVSSFKDDDTVILKIADGAKAEFTRNSITAKIS
jgi:preprotein translocase subunit YajC